MHQKPDVLSVALLSNLVGSSSVYSHSPPRHPLLPLHCLKKMQRDNKSNYGGRRKVTNTVISKHAVHYCLHEYTNKQKPCHWIEIINTVISFLQCLLVPDSGSLMPAEKSKEENTNLYIKLMFLLV